jgi:hypothetical protein
LEELITAASINKMGALLPPALGLVLLIIGAIPVLLHINVHWLFQVRGDAKIEFNHGFKQPW